MPLSDLGHRQARRAAEMLGSVKFQRLIASPLQRCMETAAAFIKKAGLDPEYDERLTERTFKPFYGLNYGEIRQHYGLEITHALQNGNSDSVNIDGFDTLEECQARILSANLPCGNLID